MNLVGKIGLAVIEFEWTGLRHSVKWSGIAESFSSLRDEKDFLFYEIWKVYHCQKQRFTNLDGG